MDGVRLTGDGTGARPRPRLGLGRDGGVSAREAVLAIERVVVLRDMPDAPAMLGVRWCPAGRAGGSMLAGRDAGVRPLLTGVGDYETRQLLSRAIAAIIP